MRFLLLAAGGLILAGALIFAVLAPPKQAPVAASFSETLQSRLKRLPGDYRGWAQLGMEYVDKARVTGDPSYYPKAEGALTTAARLNAADDAVLTGQAALAAGRHEFADAVRLSRRAIEANPYGAGAYGVLADAETQLGNLPAAAKAVDRMMALRPGVAAFARASYSAELRGDQSGARRYMEYAAGDAFAPADLAYARFYLGELALRSGELKRAAALYEQASQASPAFTPALAGKARVAALSGRLPEAVELYDQVVARLPLPQYLVEQGETRIKAGEPADWTLLRAQQSLFRAAGVRDDLTLAEFEADHGSPAVAVLHARAEYARNPNLTAADALAWALFKSGDAKAALPYAKKATATGWHNTLIRYHRARIEKALHLPVTRFDTRFDPSLPALARLS